jgi:hypothetical protein
MHSDRSFQRKQINNNNIFHEDLLFFITALLKVKAVHQKINRDNSLKATKKNETKFISV